MSRRGKAQKNAQGRKAHLLELGLYPTPCTKKSWYTSSAAENDGFGELEVALIVNARYLTVIIYD